MAVLFNSSFRQVIPQEHVSFATRLETGGNRGRVTHIPGDNEAEGGLRDGGLPDPEVPNLGGHATVLHRSSGFASKVILTKP